MLALYLCSKYCVAQTFQQSCVCNFLTKRTFQYNQTQKHSVYPRLDVNVSTHRNHLLKSPWCVHPKTGRVCVPIDPSKVDEWDPHTTPTVASLADELDSNAISNQKDEDSTSNKRMKISDVDKTSLKSYMEYFENSFLAPLYADIKQNFRDEAEKQAAITGDW